MNTAITNGYYGIKLTEANFVVGLYVIDIKRNIFITTIWEDQQLLLNLNSGVLDYFDSSSCVWIIEDDSLIKVKTAKTIKCVY